MMDTLLTHYPPGYIEVFGSFTIQILYLISGLFMESFRPAYKSSTTPKMIVQSLRNHAVATLMHVFFVMYKGGGSVLTRTFIRPYTLPTLTEVLRDLAIGLLMRDIIFWVIHRLWHARGVYRWVHAKHHEVKHPGEHHVWTISYMSVTDFVCLYGVPVVAVAKALEMNLVTTLLFAFLSATGEQVKLVWGDEAHDEHHVNGKVNLGVYGVMDWVCGTGSGKCS